MGNLGLPPSWTHMWQCPLHNSSGDHPEGGAMGREHCRWEHLSLAKYHWLFRLWRPSQVRRRHPRFPTKTSEWPQKWQEVSHWCAPGLSLAPSFEVLRSSLRSEDPQPQLEWPWKQPVVHTSHTTQTSQRSGRSTRSGDRGQAFIRPAPQDFWGAQATHH